MADKYDPESLTEMLPFYYKRIFPYGPYLRWLFYGNLDNFRKREFSFTLNGDIYARYISYNSPNELKKDLIKRPKDHLQHSVFTPKMKELVFDIDMTDYDDVRNCCSGADICEKCWRYMSIACKILDTALREDFDFQLLLWVFSGRRGIHCWVCDEAALALDGRGRSCLAEYMSVLTANPVKKVFLTGDVLHPHLKRAKLIIEDQFEKLLEEQELLSTKERQGKVLGLVSNGDIRAEIEKEWTRIGPGQDVEKWDRLVAIIKHHQAKSSDRKVKYAIEEIARATKVAQKRQLISEVEQYDEKHNLLNKTDPAESETHDETLPAKQLRNEYKKTCLVKSIAVFEEFLKAFQGVWRSETVNSNGAEPMTF
ncbi:DNA primase small subunit-like [Diaphorina citri]|uniref:DNA primase n=1 Tax=Diaphorina citri TaxID=121845 RepID=A0A1S4EBI6_DIACI|nr:DNA primase small subunit-like [Diaphorina citri]